MKHFIGAILGVIPGIANLTTPPPVTCVGEAGYYHDKYVGNTCADGVTTYDHRDKIVATYEFPLGTEVRIDYISASGQQRTAYGVVRDRGPAEYLREQGRLFDFSPSLFRKLESLKKGVISVSVTEVRR